ncbi:hypothetical protein SMACR_08719 [Sordaria macrospora]|uniref:Indole-diterpene biosynthesis protein PaxU n=1 Tax=Sordaria macrospora TaxID=5147 RepID=A0A8S8ZPL6_SORMA|nr:hypothetical protein SMACR_08719 [Sordaria macrospora]KAH7625182.1 hypothetical protein B0T09DRAFT_369513 [Sordaria sp. MPI-SDFR-AT-0083]WPJ65102.1 hypothetical protein SMAC4_08719 [Sordaria macrospora]
MASTTKAVTKDGGPLSFMTRLSQHVYLYRPSPTSITTTTTTTSSKRPPPKLILLFSWMGARDPHIAKYLTPYYQSLFPSTPILLIKSEMKHIFNPKSFWPEMEQAGVVDVLRDIFGADMLRAGSHSFGNLEGGSTTALASPAASNNDSTKEEKEEDPELLIHLFSNGGSSQLLSLHHYLLSRSSLQLRLPPHLVIFDSAPGQMAYFPSYLALSHVLLPPASRARFPLWLFTPATLQRVLIGPLIHLWVSFLWTCNFLGRFVPFLSKLESPLGRLAREQNDTSPNKGRAERERGRMYIYSEGDELVNWKDVEGHMDEARQRGVRVRAEKFEGTGHVGHARGAGNDGRYWGCVGSFWEGEGWM